MTKIQPSINNVQTQETKPCETCAKKKDKKNKDVYFDTPIRKLGFLDEIGEALRPVLSVSKNPLVRKLPNFAYIPATAYVIADVADKYKKGEDGTGKKPSVKMAVREGMFQGIVSIAAPMAIIKGTNSVMGNIIKGANKSGLTKKITEKLANASSSSKLLGKLGKNISLPLKIASAAVSLLVLSKLTKPVDWACDKFFKRVVDPVMGIGKTNKSAKAEEASEKQEDTPKKAEEASKKAS